MTRGPTEQHEEAPAQVPGGHYAMTGGPCVKLGDDVNTDVIIPGRYLISIDPKELAGHAFEPLGEEFQAKLRVAKVIVAGRNFGCGSAREQAATCLIGAGIKAVVAASFARVFFRNAINTGLIAVECPEAVAAAAEGESLHVDVAAGQVEAGGLRFPFPPYPENLRRIFEAGGLIPYVAKHPSTEGSDERQGRRATGAAPRTFAQKAIERAAGSTGLSPGDIANVSPDLYMSHTASWRCIKTFNTLPGGRIRHPERIAMVMDHISPARTSLVAGYHRLCRDFAREHGITTFYDVNAGIAHLVLMEAGHIRPGEVIIGTDSHSTIYGALGALGTGVGYSEITAAWVSGEIWMKVPESIRVSLIGRLPPGVYPKDLMLRLIGDLGADGATYCSVEFEGDLTAHLPVSQRMTLCNLAMELGAKNAFVRPDAITVEYLREAGVDVSEDSLMLPDPGASYRRTVAIDAARLEPQVSCPHTVDNVRPVREVAGTRLDQVFIGSCANAKYDDLAEVARILQGRKVASGVRLMVTPGSRAIMQRAADEGVLGTLIAAGALVTNPGCGACAGDGGALDEGETCLSTANRNFRGRMGSYEAGIYLASPATAAASALAGAIADPREYLP